MDGGVGMKDLTKLLKLLNEFGVPYKVYTRDEDADCIADEALKAKADISISINDDIDFAFDKKEKFVGHYNNQIASFKKRKK